MDIVERLRVRAEEDYEMCNDIHLPLIEAADEIEQLRDEVDFQLHKRKEETAEIERLREALKQAQCNCEEPCLHGRWCSSWIARAALKEKE